MDKTVEVIKSRQNSLIKEIRKALRGGALTEHGHLPIEGPMLIEEAVRSSLPVPVLLLEESFDLDPTLYRHLERQQTRILKVSHEVLVSVAGTEAPAGTLALVQLPQRDFDARLASRDALFLALVGLQDPGNLGAIIRSAEAFQATAILTTKNTVNAYNPKSVRASAGSIFRVPIFQGLEAAALFEFFSAHRVETIAASLQSAHSVLRAPFQPPLALFVGQEAKGLPDSILSRCSRHVRIPMSGSVQSLNAAVATSILLYEIRRDEKAG